MVGGIGDFTKKGNKNNGGPELVQDDVHETVMDTKSENQNEVLADPEIGESPISILGGMAG